MTSKSNTSDKQENNTEQQKKANIFKIKRQFEKLN
jgi:hypothetical protein